MRACKALALLGCTLLGGCLEIEQTVTLQADGGGSQHVRLTVRDRLLQELLRRQPAAQLEGSGDPTALFDEELVGPELTAAGLTLTAHDVAVAEGRRTVDLSASFPDFATLQKSPLSGSAAEWELAAGPKPGLAKLTFYPQGRAAWQQAREQAQKMREGDDRIAAQFFARQRQQLQGLDVCIRLRLPGKVFVWTRNLEKTGEQEVAAHITADQIRTPEDLVRRLAPRFQVIFDARGTSLLDG